MKKVVIIVLIILLLASGGLVTYYFVIKKDNKETKKDTKIVYVDALQDENIEIIKDLSGNDRVLYAILNEQENN